YDHAKKAKEKVDMTSYMRNLSASSLEVKRRIIRLNLEYSSLDREVDDEVLDRALKWLFDPGGAAKYIRGVANSNGLSNDASENPLRLSDLGWDKNDEVDKWPDFTDREHGPTGTLPYMSGDVIAGRCLHVPAGFDEAPDFVHEAIHDVESLLWVLVCLCLTRKGPGLGMRREEELDKESPVYNEELRCIVKKLFEGPDEELEETKISLHHQWTSFEEEVVVHFHPYFKPLKPYVLKWWNTLILGYRFRGEEFYNIHDYILRILNEAIDKIGNSATEDGEDTLAQVEIARRKEHKEKRLATFKPQGTATSATPP
ncbi:hypothetical protein C0995_014424, partial [Termitomyces sp. Mi166